jgi:hypothetical protein
MLEGKRWFVAPLDRASASFAVRHFVLGFGK